MGLNACSIGGPDGMNITSMEGFTTNNQNEVFIFIDISARRYFDKS